MLKGLDQIESIVDTKYSDQFTNRRGIIQYIGNSGEFTAVLCNSPISYTNITRFSCQVTATKFRLGIISRFSLGDQRSACQSANICVTMSYFTYFMLNV